MSESNLPTSQEVLAIEDGLISSPLSAEGEGDGRLLKQAYRDLTVELAQMRSLTRNQMERIWQLEQALDETSKISESLKRQLVGQGFLEQQLAATEEIANIQQQAIGQLKQKLVVLEQKVGEAQERGQAYQGMLDAADSLAKTRQADLSLQLPGVGELQVDTLKQQLADLDAQLAKRTAAQALLHQACQELEGDRERNLTRITELEQQTAEMQEQILSQAQQASEYETAVQHWKDRFQSAQDKVAQLKALLAQDDLPPAVVEVLAAIQALVPLEQLGRQSTSNAYPLNQDLKMDLPDFLTRRRNRTRHNPKSTDSNGTER
jgi:chromosome segregation ATPase